MNDPSPASSSAAAVRIFQDQDVVTVIERFDVPAARQPEAVGRATDHIARGWKEDSSPYWSGVADFQPDFFDVVLVEASQ